MAAAQMACSRDIVANVERMTRLIGEAGGKHADVVVFPELAVTGAMADDVLGAHADCLCTMRWRVFGQRPSSTASPLSSECLMSRARDGGTRPLWWGPMEACSLAMTRWSWTVGTCSKKGAMPKSMWFKVKGVPASRHDRVGRPLE